MNKLELAAAAKDFMAEPVMVAAFADCRSALVSKLESTPFGDVDTQHEIALMLQLLKRVREQLVMYTSELDIERNARKAERFVEAARQSYRP
jgi:hypothetical protein